MVVNAAPPLQPCKWGNNMTVVFLEKVEGTVRVKVKNLVDGADK